MKVVFVYADMTGKGKYTEGQYNHGIGSLSASLKKAGHQTSLLHFIYSPTREEFLSKLAAQSPDLVAFSSMTNMFPFVVQWSEWVKEEFQAPTICGGKHAILCPEEVIQLPAMDASCIGEGEESLVDYCNFLSGLRSDKHIPGIWLKEDHQTVRNPQRDLSDLDSLPFPDKGIFDYTNLYHGQMHTGIFMASRGCPYQCTYCCNVAFKKNSSTSGSPYVRYKSPEYIIEEIEEELQRYPWVKALAFEDDILALRLSWFEEFTELYAQRIGLLFVCNIRPNLVSSKTTSLLKRAGCVLVHIGIESGNPYIRNEILNRGLSDEQIIQAARSLKEAGIKVKSFNMLGLPFEDFSRMLDTVKLNVRAKVDANQNQIFFPYPKTPLHDLCVKHDLIRKTSQRNLFEDTTLNFDPLFRLQILFFQRFFPLLVFLYRSVYSLPPKISSRVGPCVDYLLGSMIVTRILYPPLLKVYKIMMRFKTTNRIGRYILRMVFERSVFTIEQPLSIPNRQPVSDDLTD